jgi:hypothetical protein
VRIVNSKGNPEYIGIVHGDKVFEIYWNKFGVGLAQELTMKEIKDQIKHQIKQYNTTIIENATSEKLQAAIKGIFGK